ncbi:hypothetical protein [Streptomyces rubellomurinus]|uniref:Uncharacterized protein n=2 Tax=Streptomyces TaxID=1883 RepID=A0A0F2TIA7_STRR3|nr:hypothetical protein [Streptomyces rubellomurinus]KJS62963.1 hypothetical protein VM95_05610 [Streptomyces rubellomurinus]
MHRKSRQDDRRIDVIVILAILATGVLLIVLGVQADSLGTIAIALSGLYTSWSTTRPSPPANGPAAAPRSPEDARDA